MPLSVTESAGTSETPSSSSFFGHHVPAAHVEIPNFGATVLGPGMSSLLGHYCDVSIPTKNAQLRPPLFGNPRRSPSLPCHSVRLNQKGPPNSDDTLTHGKIPPFRWEPLGEGQARLFHTTAMEGPQSRLTPLTTSRGHGGGAGGGAGAKDPS
ncbi:nucleus accumbens-associated protein 2 [Lates japonicus]|uniref:Nucleus accumbens-associated protein 2 n=1 Tax=Lates japonicus TaxID=270547 RepID=A0AAD3MJP8_LATJO|nr:nucleus accumbens-associated protein 2 [Lates japonicus]